MRKKPCKVKRFQTFSKQTHEYNDEVKQSKIEMEDSKHIQEFS